MNFRILSLWAGIALSLLGRLTVVGITLVSLTHCTHMETSAEDPDNLFKEAEEAFKDERYLIAIERYRDIKNRFPYSARAIDAELRIADCYFEQESYIEAESAYEIFKELHPNHAKIDYVQYRIALSNFNQIPSNPNRDLGAAYKAIDSFKALKDKFPASEYSAKAEDYIKEARKRLAEHEDSVANFYFEKRHYLSASYRYSSLLQEFPNLGYDELALFRLGQCYLNIRMYGNAKDALRRLLSQYPESQFKSESLALLEELNATKKTP